MRRPQIFQNTTPATLLSLLVLIAYCGLVVLNTEHLRQDDSALFFIEGDDSNSTFNCHPQVGDFDSASCDIKSASYRCLSVSADDAVACPMCPQEHGELGKYWPVNSPVPFSCPDGGYCPPDTSCVWPCPAGYYCALDSPSNLTICPENHYCRSGSSQPTECAFYDFCPSGETGLTNTNVQITSLIMLVVCLLVIWILVSLFKRKKSKSHLNLKLNLERIESNSSEISLVDFNLSDSQDMAQESPLQIDFVCNGLKLAIPNYYPDKKAKFILQNVSCIIKPGTFTAIMGPSGCGKTSFMSALCGKAWSYGQTAGTCTVSKRQISAELFQFLQPVLGFVPQEDVMVRRNTVAEVLKFQAKGRLPSDWSKSKVNDSVLTIIKALELSHIVDEKIGDEIERGISGGQRKRVNVGMEAVTNPAAIFLDEPTSGLDSYTSRALCRYLKHLAKEKGVTVVAVIHQPRVEIFNELDNLLLLRKGEVVYSGDRDKVLDFYKENQLVMEPGSSMNPADFVVDVLNEPEQEEIVKKMIKKTQEAFQKELRVYKGPELPSNLDSRPRRSGFFHFWQYLSRNATLTFQRNLIGFIMELLIAVAGSSMLTYALPKETFPDILNQFALGGVLLVLFCHFSALQAIGNEIAVFKREVAAGFGVLPYFLGKDVVYMFKAILIPLVFSIQYGIMDPHCRYEKYVWTLLGVGYASFGSGLFLSASLQPSTAQMSAVLSSFVFLMLSGYNPDLQVFLDGFGTFFGQVITGLSPLRWEMELLQPQEWFRSKEIWQFCMVKKVWETGMDPDVGTFESGTPWKLWILFGLGVFFRIAAIISLKLKTRITCKYFNIKEYNKKHNISVVEDSDFGL